MPSRLDELEVNVMGRRAALTVTLLFFALVAAPAAVPAQIVE